jgi:nitrate/nitrite transporter NarK
MIGLDAQITHWLIYANLVLSYFAVYALRGVYFALIAEVKIPTTHTGLAAGLISLVGFTPDIFFAAITGRILDGEDGFTHYFMILAAIAVLGLITASVLVYRHSKSSATGS